MALMKEENDLEISEGPARPVHTAIDLSIDDTEVNCVGSL
jgi:hypothetical protein